MSKQVSNTVRHPDYVGPMALNAPYSQRVDIAAATDADALDCLCISYIPEIQPGGTPAIQPMAGTVEVDGDGAGTQARITLRVETKNASGTANSDTEFTIDCDGAKSGWSSGAAVASSLKDIIDLINEDDAGGTNGDLLSGFKCWIGPGGMYDLWCRGASLFKDMSETYIMSPGGTGGYTGFLKRDMAVAGSALSDGDYHLIWRLGRPEVRDRGLFKLLDLYGAIGTDTGGTVANNAGVMVVRDDVEDYVVPVNTWATDIANHEIVYWVDCANLPAGSGSASNSMEHNPEFAAVERGPLVVIVKADTDFDTQTINLVARMMRA